MHLEISHSVARTARTLGPDARLPTVQHLRREFGVSLSTIDNVLAHLESHDIIYRRHGAGIFVSPHILKKKVGLICSPEFLQSGTSPFWSEIVEGMRKRATLNGEIFRFYLGLPSGRSDVPVHEDLQTDIAEQRLDGAFFIGNNRPAISWLASQNLPTVTFAGDGKYLVSIDYKDLICQSVEALQQVGCQSIGLMSPFHFRCDDPNPYPSPYQKFFREALKNSQLECHTNLIWDAGNIHGAENQTYQQQGYEAVQKLFKPEATVLPDGLVIIDDMMTRGAIDALLKRGMRLDADLKIASHTNCGSSVLQNYEQELILLEVNPAEIVDSMFEMLEALMNDEEVNFSSVEVKAALRSLYAPATI